MVVEALIIGSMITALDAEAVLFMCVTMRNALRMPVGIPQPGTLPLSRLVLFKLMEGTAFPDGLRQIRLITSRHTT